MSTGNSHRASAQKLAAEILVLSDDQKDAPLSEIHKEEHSIESEMYRGPKNFMIKRNVHTSNNNRYFRNNAHLYQNESDLRSKGMRNLK